MEPVIEFETRNVNGIDIQVAMYRGRIYRVDKEDDRLYVLPGTTAPFKYFTATEEEAKRGYSKHGQIMRVYNTVRQLVLVNMYDLATRNAVLGWMDEAERPHMEFSFPLANGNTRVSRRSEEGHTDHNYGVSRAICRLFAAHGIDGYYIARAAFHSEIMLCQAALHPTILEFERFERVSPKNPERRLKRTRANMERTNVEVPSAAAAAAAAAVVEEPAAAAEAAEAAEEEFVLPAGLQAIPSYMIGTPPRPKRPAHPISYTTPSKRRTRRTMRVRRTRRRR